MATIGDTLLDAERLEEAEDLPELLRDTRDLARLAQLLVLGLKREEQAGIHPPDYDDWALLHSILWPLERACERAVCLDQAQRPQLERGPEDGGGAALRVLDGGRA